MVFFGRGYGLQFLVTLSRWLFGASVICLCVKWQEAKPFALRKRNIIDPIADSTLEIYLLQIGLQSFMPGLPYAVGIPCFWVSALAGGILIHYLYDGCRKAFAAAGRKME